MTLLSLKIVDGNCVDKIKVNGDSLESTLQKLNIKIEEKYSEQFNWTIFYLILALSSSAVQGLSEFPYTLYFGLAGLIVFIGFLVLLGGAK